MSTRNGPSGSTAEEIPKCKWVFDLFGCAFDHLSVHLSPPDDRSGFIEELQKTNSLPEVIVAADGDIPSAIWDYLAPAPRDTALIDRAFLIRLAVVLRHIDAAAATLNYYSVCPGTSGWFRAEQYLLQHGMSLNKGSRVVVIKAPSRFPSNANTWYDRALAGDLLVNSPFRGEHWSRLFANLCRVPEIHNCDIRHRVLSRLEDGLDDVDWSTLRIGMVPLVEDIHPHSGHAELTPGSLRIVTNDDNHLMVQESGASDELCDRAASALWFLAKSKVQIVLFPEAVVPDSVVAHLRNTLRDIRRSGLKYPALVLAGTFVRRASTDGRPGYNEAIVLNGRGEELWRQAKMHPYEMYPHEQVRYGLDGLFKGIVAKEQIETTPRALMFCDSRYAGLRMAVAVCEDSVQDDPVLRSIKAFCPNLVLIPVMAGALMEDRSFVRTAGDLARVPGCLSAVVNSAALPSAEWRRSSRAGQPPVGVVGLPGLLNPQDPSYPSHVLLDRRETVDERGTSVLIFECPRPD